MDDGGGFDRLRPRAPESSSSVRPSDPEGRRALYSVIGQSPSLGTVTVECSSCKRTSVVTPRRLIGLAVPSLHLPLVKRRHPSWMRCPACGARTWVRVRLRF
jgi:uncharacterized protein with PIN domain